MNFYHRVKRMVVIAINNPGQFFSLLVAKIKSFFIRDKSSCEKVLKGGVIFRFTFYFDPVIKSMYLGTYEMDTVAAMKRILRLGDTFIDVGGNIGYLSAIALGLVGNKGYVYSFEPVQEYFEQLKNVAHLNKGYNLVVNRCALGEKDGTGRIAVTNLRNIGWNTIVPGLMPPETVKEMQEVPICRLDGYIEDNGLKNIALIKIDTEGYEFPVLKGLSKYFETSENNRPAIICEIAPSAYALLGYQLIELSQYMDKFKYRAFELSNPNKKINISQLRTTTTVLFLSNKN